MNKYLSFLKPFLLPLMGGFAFLGLIMWLKPSIWWIFGIVALSTVIFTFYYHKTFSWAVKNILINVCVVAGIYGLWRVIGVKGLLGLVLVCVIVSALIIIRRWKLFINTIREVEKIIWGKTHEPKRKRRKEERD